MSNSHQRAVFGANCYWGAEAAFRKINGVLETCVGFMGDSLCDCSHPDSDDAAKDMNQVEVVRVDFDSRTVSYTQLIEVFWGCHNVAHPVMRPEDGKPSLERSVIFVEGGEQRNCAEQSCACVAVPYTTTIEGVTHFHRAIESEQRYLERNEGAVCSMKDAQNAAE